MNKTFFFLALLFLPLTLATSNQPYSLKLLAVEEADGQYLGSDADLILELKESGSGRVFLETTPLTKLDTQISTRFAKEIACNHFKLDCSQYDFIYTIKAKSSIIGGPSAGAAIAALTTIAVLDLDHDETVAVTGTINSGGIVGPVGGAKEKIEAAARVNLKKVLIPLGVTEQPSMESVANQTNATFDLISYGASLKLDVVEVVDLDEVLRELTGVDLNHQETVIAENDEYAQIMQQLQEDLCQRSLKIKEEIAQNRLEVERDIQEEIEKAEAQALNATGQHNYYSAASFCFSNNIRLRKVYYTQKNLSLGVAKKLFQILQEKNKALEQELQQQPLDTITALQTQGIVAERLQEVKEQLKMFEELLKQNTTLLVEDYAPSLAYGEERYYSALSWQKFFQMSGKKLHITPETMKSSCFDKIAEAEERLQYVGLFIPANYLGALPEKIALAEEAQEREEYPLCLITAAQAKAEANAILSSLGIDNSTFQRFVQAKHKAVARVIADNTAEGMFPLLGYSYYQYALTLQGQSPESALMYLEYALEMSDLGIYFPEEKKWSLPVRDRALLWFGGGGFVAGVIITLLGMLLAKAVRKKIKVKISLRK